MPKRPNAKKIASQSYSKIKSLNEAVSEGKYYVAKVEKCLGFCSFQAKMDSGSGVRDVTVLVRGKMKGGKNCPTRVEPGCFVLVEGNVSRILEVVGVVNKQDDFNKLKKAGRVHKKLLDDIDEDDIFDRTGQVESEDIWAKRDEEREEQADALVGLYMSRANGKAVKGKDAVLGSDESSEDDSDDFAEEEGVEEEVAEDGSSEPAFKPITSARRLRKIAMREAEAEAAVKAELEAIAAEKARIAALYAAQEAEEASIRKVLNRKVKASWEDEDDEIDIDAI